MKNAEQLLKASRELKQIYIDLVPIGNGRTMASLELAIENLELQYKALCCPACGNYKIGEGATKAEECKC